LVKNYKSVREKAVDRSGDAFFRTNLDVKCAFGAARLLAFDIKICLEATVAVAIDGAK
jgi:hypothetical protein